MSERLERIAKGTWVRVQYGNAAGAEGVVTNVYRDPPSIDVAILASDENLKQEYFIAPDGYVHLRLAPGEFEPMKQKIITYTKPKLIQ